MTGVDGNFYGESGFSIFCYFFADLIIHPSHFGGFTTEAIVTGALTAIISLMLNWLGKKLFIHGRDKLLKH